MLAAGRSIQDNDILRISILNRIAVSEHHRDATEMLIAAHSGDGRAADRLLPLVYDELRSIAGRMLGQNANQTLQPTALVHEAYLRLVDQTRATYQNRAHFAAVAATMMRRVLVDSARRRGRQKREGGHRRESLTRVESCVAEITDFAELDHALTNLAMEDARAAHVVELRYFGGLTIDETAVVLSISTPTVERDWRFARAWLHQALASSDL